MILSLNTVRKLIKQGLDSLALAFAVAAAAGMIGIVAIIVSSVFLRKFANSPLHITEEVVGLLLSVSLFLGLPAVTLKAKHVRVALLTSVIKGKLNDGLQFLALVVGIGFFTWLIVEAIPWFEFAHRLNLKTETSRILLYPWMAVLPVSLVLTCTILIARLLGIIDRGDDSETEINSALTRSTDGDA